MEMPDFTSGSFTHARQGRLPIRHASRVWLYSSTNHNSDVRLEVGMATWLRAKAKLCSMTRSVRDERGCRPTFYDDCDHGWARVRRTGSRGGPARCSPGSGGPVGVGGARSAEGSVRARASGIGAPNVTLACAGLPDPVF